jgi:hypothetical protein
MKRIAVIGTVLFALILAEVALAQEPAAPMPEILKRVLTLEGKWVATVSMQAEGKTTQYKECVHFRKTADKSHLLFNAKADIPGQGKILEDGLIGYDVGSGKLRWLAMNNDGEFYNGIGELPDPNHLRLIFEGQRDGKALRTVADLIWKNDKTIEFKEVTTLDGEVQAQLEGTFVRKFLNF